MGRESIARVIVEIYSADQLLLEKGDAVADGFGVSYIYTTTQTNAALAGSKIIAIAIDVPGNEGVLEQVL